MPRHPDHGPGGHLITESCFSQRAAEGGDGDEKSSRRALASQIWCFHFHPVPDMLILLRFDFTATLGQTAVYKDLFRRILLFPPEYTRETSRDLYLHPGSPECPSSGRQSNVRENVSYTVCGVIYHRKRDRVRILSIWSNVYLIVWESVHVKPKDRKSRYYIVTSFNTNAPRKDKFDYLLLFTIMLTRPICHTTSFLSHLSERKRISSYFERLVNHYRMITFS